MSVLGAYSYRLSRWWDRLWSSVLGTSGRHPEDRTDYGMDRKEMNL